MMGRSECALNGASVIVSEGSKNTAQVRKVSARSSVTDWPVIYPGTSPYNFGVYVSAKMFPTRNGYAHLLWGWTSCIYEGSWTATSAQIFFCRNKPTLSNFENEEALGVVEKRTLYDISESQIHEEWYSLSKYGDYYYMVRLEAAGSPDGSDWWIYYCAWGNQTLSSLDFMVGGAPSLYYDESKNAVSIGTSMQGRRVLEFSDSDRISPTNISDAETLNNFLLSALIDLEGYGTYGAYFYNTSSARLTRWPSGSYSVGLIDTQSDEFSDFVSAALDNAVAEMNTVLQEFGISLYRNDKLGSGANITVTYGTMQSLWGETIDLQSVWFHGGQWDTYEDSHYNITGAKIGIAKEAHYYTTFSRVVLEELYQCFGCGHDQWEYPQNTTTCELGGVWTPDHLTQKDADMLRLVYSDALSPGDDAVKISLVHNIPSGCKLVSEQTGDQERTLSLNFLTRGHTYRMRAWIIQGTGVMSATSDWITVVLPNGPPLWDWQASNGSASTAQTQKAYNAVTGKGPLSDFSYWVWNDLVDKIYEAAGGAWNEMYATYQETKMTSTDKVLTAKRFNAARQNIGRNVSTGIGEVSAGDLVFGSYFVTMTDKLNQWIKQL